MVALILWRVKLSLAAVNTAIARTPAANARSIPLRLGTSTGYWTLPSCDRPAMTAPASLNWGMACGLTKEVASMTARPDPARRRIRLSSVRWGSALSHSASHRAGLPQRRALRRVKQEVASSWPMPPWPYSAKAAPAWPYPLHGLDRLYAALVEAGARGRSFSQPARLAYHDALDSVPPAPW